MSTSALSQRRTTLPLKIFETVTLTPLALLKQYSDFFYQGLSLVVIEGTLFSAPNRSSIFEKDNEGLPAVCVILAKTQELLDVLWIVLKAAQTLFNTQQCDDLVAVTLTAIRKEVVLPQQQSRSLPREVRQPFKQWPRLIKKNFVSGPFQIATTPIS